MPVPSRAATSRRRTRSTSSGARGRASGRGSARGRSAERPSSRYISGDHTSRPVSGCHSHTATPVSSWAARRPAQAAAQRAGVVLDRGEVDDGAPGAEQLAVRRRGSGSLQAKTCRSEHAVGAAQPERATGAAAGGDGAQRGVEPRAGRPGWIASRMLATLGTAPGASPTRRPIGGDQRQRSLTASHSHRPVPSGSGTGGAGPAAGTPAPRTGPRPARAGGDARRGAGGAGRAPCQACLACPAPAPLTGRDAVEAGAARRRGVLGGAGSLSGEAGVAAAEGRRGRAREQQRRALVVAVEPAGRGRGQRQDAEDVGAVHERDDEHGVVRAAAGQVAQGQGAGEVGGLGLGLGHGTGDVLDGAGAPGLAARRPVDVHRAAAGDVRVAARRPPDEPAVARDGDRDRRVDDRRTPSGRAAPAARLGSARGPASAASLTSCCASATAASQPSRARTTGSAARPASSRARVTDHLLDCTGTRTNTHCVGVILESSRSR